MILRKEHRERFTCIDNQTIEDARLSFKALGLLAYLLSRPDGWEVRAPHLASTHGDGEYAVRAALTELGEAGYLERRQEHTPGGHFIYVTVVHEVPHHDAETAHRTAVTATRETATRETAARSKEGGSKDGGSKDTAPAAPSLLAEGQGETDAERLERERGKGRDYRFEDWWALYPMRRGKRVARRQAAERWRALSYVDKGAAFRGVRHYAAYCEAGGTIAADAHRWLRDRAWEDHQTPAKTDRPPAAGAAQPEWVQAEWQGRTASEGS
ncbi:MAG: hypothetical protein ACRDXE_11275 [Acidimicrobiales bacterium]